MIDQLIARLEKGVFGTIGHAIGAILRNSFIGLVVGLVLGEGGGAVIEGKFLPSTVVTVLSIAFALVLAFAVAMTTALSRTVRGLLDLVRGVEGEAGKALGDVGQGAAKVVDSVEHRK